MKIRKVTAGVLAAALLATGVSYPSQPVGICAVCEAASKLKVPKLSSKSSTYDSVTLKWKSVKGADGYLVYMYNVDTEEFELWDAVSERKCTITGLAGGVQYMFRIAAYVEEDGEKVPQKLSGIKRMTTKKLPAPGGLKASGSTDTVKLSWNAVQGAKMYRVYIYNDTTLEYEELIDVAEPKCDAAGLPAGKTYKFKVCALADDGVEYIPQKMSGEVSLYLRKNVTLGIPDCMFCDINNKEYNLSNFVGKPTIVYFWTRWGLRTESEIKAYNKFAKEYGDKLQIIMINCEGKSLKKFVEKYLDDLGNTIPVYYDWTLNALEKYETRNVPLVMALDSDGQLAKVYDCELSQGTIKELIERIVT